MKKSNNEHILFSNYFWENDNYGMDKYDYAREYLFTEYSEDEGWKTETDVPENRVIDEVYSQSEWEWEDFKAEFGKFIKDSYNGFILIGDCGLWDGRSAGGCYINKFDDLYNFWDGCRDIKVWDDCGHLFIKATHHDGTNYAELKELTCKGSNYANNHYYDSDEDVHNTIWNSNFYSRLPHFAHKVWGCRKGA